jgi:hypothetical protein
VGWGITNAALSGITKVTQAGKLPISLLAPRPVIKYLERNLPLTLIPQLRTELGKSDYKVVNQPGPGTFDSTNSINSALGGNFYHNFIIVQNI